MDSKITLSFDEEVIGKAKAFAARHHTSLSRMTEHFYRYVTSGNYKQLEDIPVADWVNRVSEGSPVYLRKRRTKKELRSEYYKNRKKKR